VLLTVALALALSILPTTQPGLGPDEGVFLQTQADDGGPVDYFIAQGARHAILDTDVQAELRLNPLWPFRVAPRDEVLAFAEGAPVGSASLGRLGQPSVAEDEVVVADDAPVTADEAAVVADDAVADDQAGAEAEEQTYTVKRGDTLIGIAARFSTTEADLMAINNLSNRNRIYAGQVLLV
jgi:nucleoid-associated protein YgaU